MTYVEWLNKQEHESALKDLGTDIQMDYSFPHGEGFEQMLDYFELSDVRADIIALFKWSYSVYLDQTGGNHESKLKESNQEA